nr:conserved hypothetical protein [Albugo laibachii Nc14]|eukprot:CCA14577.1 conserved hypothetical protein [Albugo laibachii Nc14]
MEQSQSKTAVESNPKERFSLRMCQACWVTIKNSDKVECSRCRTAFHFHCANVPTTVHPIQFFCSWACLVNVKKINKIPDALQIDFEALMRKIQKLSKSRDHQRKAIAIDEDPPANRTDTTTFHERAESQCKRRKFTVVGPSDLKEKEHSAALSTVKVSPPTQSLPNLTAITSDHPRHFAGETRMKNAIAAGNMVRPMQESTYQLRHDKALPPIVATSVEQGTERIQKCYRETSRATKELTGIAQRALPDVPWLNLKSLPQNMLKRFVYSMDKENSIFRADLTPASTKMHCRLEQEEIDFFFRCLESPDANLVVKGMSSTLNQYIWLWPFVLESCGLDTRFTFDRFVIIQCTNGSAELEYIGEVVMTLATYQTYLEAYSSKLGSDQEIVALDCATKSAVFIRIKENIIAFNTLNITKHCPQVRSLKYM